MSHNQPVGLERLFPTYAPPLYFVTPCAAERREIFDIAQVHNALFNDGRHAQDYDIVVGRYGVMPDHIDFFVQDRA